MRVLARAVWIALVAACEHGAVADEGRDAALQIDGARFVRGDLPESEGGPPVLAASLTVRANAGQVRGAVAGENAQVVRVCDGALRQMALGGRSRRRRGAADQRVWI